MIKIEEVDVWGFKHAIRGMRNPMNSWSKSDTKFFNNYDEGKADYIMGKDDLDLMKRLYKGGSEHRKYLRQIIVSMDITCNQTWWAEFDTYKVGVVRDSCSKMHRIHVKQFTPDDFSTEGIDEVSGRTKEVFDTVLEELERLRNLFNETQERKYWRAIIDLLPMGYNLKATVTMNYENAINMIRQRTGHKMIEWNYFVDFLKTLPYIKEIMGEE